MKLELSLLLAFVLLPFLALFLPWSKSFNRNWLTLGAVVSIGRIALLSILGNTVLISSQKLLIQGSLVSGYPLDIVLSLDPRRFGFLLVAELCFLLAHWMSTVVGRPSLVRRLICLTQGITALFVLSDNAIAAGGLLILGGASIFYLVRFSAGELLEDLFAEIANRVYVLSFILGALMISWGIIEFGQKNMLLTKGSDSKWGSAIWILMLILSAPVSPWSHWLRKSLKSVPEGVTLTVMIFLSGVLLKHSAIFAIVYPDLPIEQRTIIYGFGLLGCILALLQIFLSKNRREMLGGLPSFFFSLVLVALGVSKQIATDAPYYICVFLPALSALILYATSIQVVGNLQKIYMALLCVLVLGVPGTPAYLIFSNIGARSLDLGVSHIIIFGLLWFLYFCSAVYIGRRLFLDKEAVELGFVNRLEEAQAPIAAYGVFFMFFLILISQLSWRIL
jgi:hypothetical protein